MSSRRLKQTKQDGASAGAAAPQPAAAKAQPTHEEIARRAYELFLERGGESGQDIDDWLRAETELHEHYDGGGYARGGEEAGRKAPATTTGGAASGEGSGTAVSPAVDGEWTQGTVTTRGASPGLLQQSTAARSPGGVAQQSWSSAERAGSAQGQTPITAARGKSWLRPPSAPVRDASSSMTR